MTIHEPNPDVRPTGEEAAEFVEPPQDERGPADPGSDEEPREQRRSAGRLAALHGASEPKRRPLGTPPRRPPEV